MFRACVAVLVIVALMPALPASLAQTTQSKDQQDEVVRVGSNEVVLDAHDLILLIFALGRLSK